jgi:hypothetical protein
MSIGGDDVPSGMFVPFTRKQTLPNFQKSCPEIFPRTSTAAILENGGFCHPIVVGPSSSIRLKALVMKKGRTQ